MRKFLGIVITILMVSAMFSTMAFAAASITCDPVTGLVAGEAFNLVATVSEATTATLEVNNQVFGITGGIAADSITSLTVNVIDGTATFPVTVNTSVPATFTSDVKITAGDASIKVAISVADRLVGDVNGDSAVTIQDAAEIAAFLVGKTVSVNFNSFAGNVNLADGVTIQDAAELAASLVDKPVTVSGIIGTARVGGNASIDIVDPFDVQEPETTPLAAVTDLYTYFQNGTLYYTFTGSANAESYEITVGTDAPVVVTATSGSIADVVWDGTGTLPVSVVAKTTNAAYTDSDAVSVNAVYATVSGALSQWLADNNLSDCAITVYEITAPAEN